MLEVDGLGHAYREGAVLLDGLSFRVEAGELVCLVGPSGSGKSTLLRAIAGLLQPSRGSVRLFDKPVHAVPHGLGVVFQDYGRSLFPWLTVAGNVAFPLGNNGLGRAEVRGRVEEALAWVGLAASSRAYPWQLSGGMQQRVAIARALAYRPALLLMDEPFASVDAHTRAELEDLLLQLRARHEMTVLLVTHDIDESVYLGDRVLVLSAPPSRLLGTLAIGLPRARDQIATRSSPEFVRLRTEVALAMRAAHGRASEKPQ